MFTLVNILNLHLFRPNITRMSDYNPFDQSSSVDLRQNATDNIYYMYVRHNENCSWHESLMR